MRYDIEHLDYDKLDASEKIEFGAILEANVNTLILQLLAGKEKIVAEILSASMTLRLAERNDLVQRFAQFGQELCRIALTDRQRDLFAAKVLEKAITEARQAGAEIDKGDTEAEIVDETKTEQ